VVLRSPLLTGEPGWKEMALRMVKFTGIKYWLHSFYFLVITKGHNLEIPFFI
jgi:hypothetical protein